MAKLIHKPASTKILHANSIAHIDLIRKREIQAVIFDEEPLPSWFNDLRAAVARGAFQVQRSFSTYLTVSECHDHLENVFPPTGIDATTRQALIDDVLRLVELCRRVTSARSFRIRCLTAVPNGHHGFHVDVAQAVPCRRILRVYGDGTQYFRPDDMLSFREFYLHLDKRHALAQQLYATPPSTAALRKRLELRLASLERQQRFHCPNAIVQQTPVGAIIAIESVHTAALWPDPLRAGKAIGWVHRSPMSGQRRLVVSISNAPL